MSAILTADIHETDKPGDAYRWGLFDWLAAQRADEMLILGDLTDAKDRHSAVLVNRLVSEVRSLRRYFRIIIVRGNHDYYSVDQAFFQFLEDEGVQFITEPTELQLSIGSAFFVPAGVTWDFEIPQTRYLFTHATFSGARAENGTSMTGVDPAVLSGFKGKVYSGDIHVPQTLAGGRIVYVGAPYHTRFGDEFDPRVLHVANDGREKDLHFEAPRKWVFHVTQPKDLLDEDAVAGDYVKVRCLLRRADYDKWRGYHADIRQVAADRGWVLYGAEPVPIELSRSANGEEPAATAPAMDPEALLVAYAQGHKASDDYVAVGRELMSKA